MAACASRQGRVSAPVYFSCIALVTLLGIGVAMQLRPGFGHAVRELVGLEREPQAGPRSFYTVRVAPLLADHCVGCHGERRQKAQLRLDSFAAVLRGGRHGAVVQPGDVKDSELFTRMTLPATDDRAMPPSGKTPLTPDEITVFRLWIAAGASGSRRTIRGAPRLVAQAKIPEFDPRLARKQRAALADAVKQLQARFPGVISYESRGSANLEVNAAFRGPSFGDDALRALAPLQTRIVRADFSGTAITDASAAALAAMRSLRVLRLANTGTGDATIQALAPLKALRSLTVVGTHVTGKALTGLRARGVAVYGGGDGH
jgi:hypothetical protein